ncbi:MAG TPA: hypothetical protein DDW52_12230 [Planctomycetaceae bacterium]|nr:hypothetical protein [Planctomycetaceae bacterium]
MNGGDENEAKKQLEIALEEASSLTGACRYKSAYEAYSKLRRMARREEDLYHYVLAVFYMMDSAANCLDSREHSERAIELIALLESEEQARKIDPNFSIDLYESLIYHFSSCAYENLADATGSLKGYNSEGLQDCISDGLNVCRTTGKLECVGCFREYSCDVHMSADDAQLAAYQCNLVLEEAKRFSNRGDRRWLAKRQLALLAILDGRGEEAIRLARESVELAKSKDVNFPERAGIRALCTLDEILTVCGRPRELHDDPISEQFSKKTGEAKLFETQVGLADALALTAAGKYDQAAAILTPLDREFSQKGVLSQWFEVRLRLVANSYLSNETELAERLSKQLESRANEASDWLTIRRLAAVQNEDLPTNPLCTFRVVRMGDAVPTASKPDSTASARDSVADESSSGEEDEYTAPDQTPLAAELETLGKQFAEIAQSSDLEDLSKIREQVLSYKADNIVDPTDAFRLLHMAAYTFTDPAAAQQIWNWANEVVSKFSDHSTALSLLADIGNRIRYAGDDEFSQSITRERVEPLIRKSLELSNVGPRSYMRAGDHFDAEGDRGEAERCYARGFRLQRSAGDIAVRLARVYRETDRPRDALYVLDLCLREGTEDPSVAWEAGVLAFSLQRYSVMHTYLEKFVQQAGPQPWVDYYHAIGHYEQQDYEAAIKAIDAEEQLLGQTATHLQLVQASILVRQGKSAEAESRIDEILKQPFHEVEFIAPGGLVELLERLRTALAATEHTKASELSKRMLRAGMATEDYFEVPGEDLAASNDLNFYRCLLKQPLDENWASEPDRMVDQENWTAYMAEWGVLAENEDQARDLALQWQHKCYHLPAEVVVAEQAGDNISGAPRVVWQGIRFDENDFIGLPDSDSSDE